MEPVAKGKIKMAGKIDKLVKAVRVELSEAVLADKEDATVRARACLLHAKRLLDGFLRKEYGYDKDSKVGSAQSGDVPQSHSNCCN